MKLWRNIYRTTLLLGVVFFAFSNIAQAEDVLIDKQPTAVATNLGLFGGSPLDIEVDPNDDGQYVYVATYTPNGIFSSQNSGETWTGLSAEVDYGAGKSIIIDPATGDVYAAIGDDLIKSTNHGNIWNSLTDNLVNSPLVGSELAWADETLLVAVDNGAVQYSTDNGETFSSATLEAGTGNNIISMSGDNAGTFYAVLQDFTTEATKLFVSTDQAVTWAEMDVTSAGVAADSVFYDIAVDPLNSNHLILSSYHPDYYSYQSFDRGTSWATLTNGSIRIGGEEAIFDGVGGLYLGVYYTSDASGPSPVWSALNTDTPLSSISGDIYAVDAVHPTTVYTDSAMGVAKSEDNGANWVDSVEGITAVATYAIGQANDKDIVWLGANGGLAKTTNFTSGQPDWEYPILPTENGSSIYAVWVKPNDAEYVVTGSSNFLYYTADGGDTWTQADAPDFTGTVQTIVRSPNNPEKLYAMYVNTSLTEDLYNGGMLKSTDLGVTWEEMDFPTTLADGDLVIAEQDGVDVPYVGIGPGGSDNGIYEFRDGEWSKLDVDFNEFYVNNLLIHPEDSRIIFASFEAASTVGSLYRSTDAGETWTELTEGLGNTNHLGPMAAESGDTTTLYLAGQDGDGGEGMLYKSTDGGNSWSIYYEGKKQEFFYDLLFDGLISGNDRGVYNLKSLGKVVLKKKSLGEQEYKLITTLKDASTKDLLTGKKVRVFKKPKGKAWREVQVKETNENGVAKFIVHGKKGSKFKVVWKPNSADREAFARSTSRIITID